MGESSRKTSLERHEEQIKEILNQLPIILLTSAIPQAFFKNMEKALIKTKSPIRTSTSEEPPAMTQAAIRELVADSVTAGYGTQDFFKSLDFLGVALLAWSSVGVATVSVVMIVGLVAGVTLSVVGVGVGEAGEGREGERERRGKR
ncbi:hypothetical protein Tco_0348206 [Tanacetum coccineum]